LSSASASEVVVVSRPSWEHGTPREPPLLKKPHLNLSEVVANEGPRTEGLSPDPTYGTDGNGERMTSASEYTGSGYLGVLDASSTRARNKMLLDTLYGSSTGRVPQAASPSAGRQDSLASGRRWDQSDELRNTR